MEPRLEALEQKVEQLRRPIIPGRPLAPPVGVIADFVGEIDDPRTARRATRDWLPLPDVENREGYSPDSHARYWTSGLEDYDKVMAAWRQHAASDGGRLYDFGGSTGRVFRHFLCQSRRFEVWSSDFSAANFAWNQRFLPEDARVFLNTFVPALPLPDRHFDVITAFSVFTHIDELESSWLLELRRVLRPGGLLYVTVHDEAYWDEAPDWMLRTIARSPNGTGITRDSGFPGDRVAYHFTTDTHYSCHVFHAQEYVRSQWGRYFDVLAVRPQEHGSQCVVLLTYR